MLALNKKAESLMVGYVLLIAIAIALSSAVFFYLKLYVPEDKAECDVDIKLVIDSVSCVWNQASGPLFSNVKINVTNKGLFNVEGAYIKIGDADRVFKEDLNPSLTLISPCNGNLTDPGVLKPGQTFCKEASPYSYNKVPNVEQEISVQPVVYINGKPVLCPDGVVSKRVTCVSP